MFKAAIYLYESEDYGIITLKILLRRRADNKPVDISDVKIHHGKTINTMSSGKSKIIWYDPSPSESKGSAFSMTHIMRVANFMISIPMGCII